MTLEGLLPFVKKGQGALVWHLGLIHNLILLYFQRKLIAFVKYDGAFVDYKCQCFYLVVFTSSIWRQRKCQEFDSHRTHILLNAV